ncbi:addiction module antitoxin [Enterobacter asburiae]|uniref:Addiction module antitoxin n=1 Tax=Enterobacter asburiae TaxID=61645 RepID=A0A376FID1_ENTAS|nr:addiction module antitoxin [Enterobacter asburiae]
MNWAFDPRALKEWSKLGETVKDQFKKKLAEVLVNPRGRIGPPAWSTGLLQNKTQIAGLSFGLSGSGQRCNGICYRYR